MKRHCLISICAKAATVLAAAAMLSVWSGCSFIDGLAVDSYLHKVGAIQQSSNQAIADLNEDANVVHSGKEEDMPGALERLGAERDAIASGRDQMALLDAPEAAQGLKDDLGELYDEGESLVDDLIIEGNYRLAMAPALKDYENASQTFSAQLKSAGSDPAAVISCLAQYEEQLKATSDKISALEPPDSLNRNHWRFVSSISVLKSGIADSIAGFSSGDRNLLASASAKMAQVDGTDASLHSEMDTDRVMDIATFNARIHRLDTLSEQVGRDMGQLRQQFDKR